MRVKIGCGSQKDWREREKKGYVKGVHVSRKTQGCVGGKRGDRKVGKRAGRHRPCNRPIASCSGGTCIVGKAARGENKMQRKKDGLIVFDKEVDMIHNVGKITKGRGW